MFAKSFSMQSASVVVCLLAANVFASVLSAQETFILEAPGDPPIRSTAFMTGKSMTIRDETGRSFDYIRQPEMDARDGSLIGFYSNDTRQFLRFPASGSGAMFIGTMRGPSLTWKQSRMRVSQANQVNGAPLASAGAPTPLRYGGGDSVTPSTEVITSGRTPRGRPIGRRAPMHVSAFHDSRRTAAGFVGQEGELNLYQMRDGDWRPVSVRSDIKLPERAPLSIAPNAGDDLAAYAISPRGDVVNAAFAGGTQKFRPTTPTKFPLGGHVATLPRKGGGSVFAVDEKGILWEGDIATSLLTPLSAKEGVVAPGAPLAVVQGVADELYFVSTAGDMVRMERGVRGWANVESIGRGFSPNGALSAVFDSKNGSTYITAVDRSGALRVLQPAGGRWKSTAVESKSLQAGMPVSITMHEGAPRVSVVRDSGDWVAYDLVDGGWRSSAIGSGLPAYSDVALAGSSSAFAIDESYRLISGSYYNGRWDCVVCRPGSDIPYRIAAREVAPGPPIKPAIVRLENRHDEELLVRIFDRRASQRPLEFTLAPGETKPVPLDRDAGGVVTESYLERGFFGGFVERVRTVPIPPAQFYDVVVYENSVASVYFDRTTNKTDVPDEVQRSLRSIGAFPIPPGALLPEGARIDVYREASSQKNPGAVRLFDLPR